MAVGVREPFDQEDADALAPASTVRGLGEGLAPAVGRQPPLPAELDERRGRRHHCHAAGQGQGALTRAQGLDGQVQRDQ